ncbi:MAG: hypothetical protein NTY35_06715 [Planctomycetota bacterium]|nr:hypothetical protein [Planctomycetota bacterium]
MKLRALSIERLAGLRTGLRLGPEHLAGRVRVLHGPNAIGKSSIVRALKALLWPSRAPVQGHVEIEGRFEIDGVEWTARRDGATTRWTRDGNAVDAPPLPAWEHADQILIGLGDLGSGGARGLEEHVQRELGGGYDVAAVEDAIQRSAPTGRAEAGRLRDAEGSLRRAQHAQAAVVLEWATLEDLRRERDAALGARKRVESLEKALAHALARAKRQDAKSALDAVPARIELLRGTEAEELDGIRGRLATALENVRMAREKEARLDLEIRALRLTKPVPQAQVDELNERVGELKDADKVLSEAEAEAGRLRSREADAVAVFGPDADLGRLAGLDEKLDDEVERFARDSQAHAELRSELLAGIAALGEDSSAKAPASRAIVALEDWLATPRAPATDARPRKILLGLAVLLLALAVGLAFAHVAFLALALLAVAAYLGSRTAAPAAGRARADHEAEYERTAEPAPAAWSEDSVRARLDELRTRLARAKDAEQRSGRRRELDGKRAALEADATSLADRRAGLASRLGAAGAAPDGFLAATARARRELREARNELHAAATAWDALSRARAGVLEKLNACLRPLDLADVADHAEAKACVASLARTSSALVSLQKDRDTQATLARGAQENADRCATEIAAVFRRNELEPGDEAALEIRLEHREAWRAAREAHRKAEREVELLEGKFPVELASETAEALVAGLEASRKAAEQADELVRQCTEIETRLSDAQKGRALEIAQAERAACREALSAAFAKARRGELARALLADVREAHDTSSRPRLVQTADELFARFTHGRYGLRTPKVGGRVEFRAYDAQDANRPFALDELSDGTRAQLLLAARLAYLREIEHGRPMPVVLDDALATSDPARMRQIGAALLAVAREEGRQFLVLTKDASDIELLRPKDTAPGEVEATDLAAVRAAQSPVASREPLRAEPPPSVPEPRGADAAAYFDALATAAMPVRPVDPRRPVEELHLWWVLQHDLGLLHRLLAHRIDTVAALQSAVRLSHAAAGPRELASAAPWIALAQGVFAAWLVGRGNPIDREVLERAGVSATYIDGMTVLARELEGDAKAWIRAVGAGKDPRAKRYREKTLEANREYLASHGYLDESEPLDAESAWLRATSVLVGELSIAPEALHELRARFELLWRACGSPSARADSSEG